MRIYCVSRMWERRTCLRSESISSSFCFIWARRYSRLLKGENEHSSSSREVQDEGGRETARSSIMGGGGKVGGGAKTEEDFSAEQGLPNKNGRATRRRREGGDGSLWGTSWFSAFDNTIMLARSAALAHVLARRKITFHLMERTRSRLFELVTRIRQDVRTA